MERLGSHIHRFVIIMTSLARACLAFCSWSPNKVTFAVLEPWL